MNVKSLKNDVKEHISLGIKEQVKLVARGKCTAVYNMY